MDQGGELWNSDDIREVINEAEYDAEPTGSDAGFQNGCVERLNGTFGVKTRAELYSAGLHPKFWSVALTHCVYLKNCLVHSAINKTPYEAWTGQKPDISHLQVFGALVTARKSGTPAAKLDKHTSHGIFLDFGATPKHICYWDLDTHRVKLSTHHVFDECHYASHHKPPGPQLLFDLGLSPPKPYQLPPHPEQKNFQIIAMYPPSHTKPLPKVPPLARTDLIPLAEFVPAPTAVAASATTQGQHKAFTVEDIHSIVISSNPFGQAFDQLIPLNGKHPTAGLVLSFHKARQCLQLTDETG